MYYKPKIAISMQLKITYFHRKKCNYITKFEDNKTILASSKVLHISRKSNCNTYIIKTKNGTLIIQVKWCPLRG